MAYVQTSALKNATIMLLYAERDEIKLDPEYQRSGGVWTMNKRRLLIDSILNDYDIPKLYFHDLGDGSMHEEGKSYAVIDGRQRLETIWSFMDGGFTLSDDFEYQRDPEISMAGFTYEDIAKKFPKIRIKFDSFVLPIVLVSVTDDDIDLIEDMFSRLNEAVPLNAAEKRNAIGGDLVAAINEVSRHKYFSEKVKFNDARYKHREVAARLLLLEDSLQERGSLIDTKREYLDGLATRLKSGNKEKVEELKRNVIATLDVMASTFSKKDDLLMAQGIQAVYYLLFRSAKKYGASESVDRAGLIKFRKSLSENRELAASDYEKASFELLEFDRLNQQGTNDANSIKERYSTLCKHFEISPDPLIAT
ncbi:DUF262 domain-containing protein [Rhodovulum sulfidophilum]|uniref:DUF262 domain-containing protein n=1 Tax=Rhodovulum sulfidophilum TaxID=35806 RepID=A0ABS1RYC2_RHOSU|nr:DUF262 domain-containing protein [Rhodovulum sulfidophilum]MBL3611051.1 DUF262 domain-containing protein [Rhodovulum sulfidophilum]MCE8455387.1 DUF262 domain-containing protein [Rhodovulum sulfidophilum]